MNASFRRRNPPGDDRCPPGASVALGVAALLAVAALAGCSGGDDAPADLAGGWRLELTRVPEESLTVGDPIHVRLVGTLPAAAEVVPSPWATLSGDLALRRVGSVRRATRDTVSLWSQDAEIAAFATGAVRIGPLAIAVVASGDTVLHTSDTLAVRIASVLGDSLEMADLRDIKPPVALGRGRMPWVLAAAALVLLALVAAFLIWRRRRVRALAETPLPPPWEEFRDGHRALMNRDLPSSGAWGEYTLELGWLARRYLERRLDAPVLEMTTLQIRRWIGGVGLGPKAENRLVEWLNRSDLIKFAGSVPTLAECTQLGREVRDWVEQVETFLRERESEEQEAAAAAEASVGPEERTGT